MFQSTERVFSSRNPEKKGIIEWFFNAREGIYGPYDSKHLTESAIQLFVIHYTHAKDDGGRSEHQKKGIPILPSQQSMIMRGVYEPMKKRKGVEDVNSVGHSRIK